MKAFIDTNVIIDVLEKRHPFYLHSANIIELGATGNAELFTSALSLINCIYICRKGLGQAKAVEYIGRISSIIRISPLTEKEFNEAISMGTSDVEDAIQYCSAISAGCEVLITRNKKDYPFSSLPVMTPEEFLNNL